MASLGRVKPRSIRLYSTQLALFASVVFGWLCKPVSAVKEPFLQFSLCYVFNRLKTACHFPSLSPARRLLVDSNSLFAPIVHVHANPQSCGYDSESDGLVRIARNSHTPGIKPD